MNAGPLLAALAIALLAANSSESGHHWSYSGAEGPSHWAGTCATGKAQSPVDISTKSATQEKLAPLSFSYKPGALHIIDNGHSVQVDVDQGSMLEVGGTRYTLAQFHFHKPSEEAVDGRHSAMVIHLVHKDAKGNLAVVAVPVQEGPVNPVVASLWSNIPHEKGHEASPAKVSVDPSGLLPVDRSYFTYTGSLTTPPCTEGVRWFVLRHPITLSASEIATFGKLYPVGARPVQPLNGRHVLASK